MSYVFHLSWTYYTNEIQVYKHFADWIPSRYCVAWINRFLLFVATTNMPFKLCRVDRSERSILTDIVRTRKDVVIVTIVMQQVHLTISHHISPSMQCTLRLRTDWRPRPCVKAKAGLSISQHLSASRFGPW